MKEKIRNYIPHFYIVVMCYILATHFLFQWWNSLILFAVLLVVVTLARRFLTRQTFRNRMFITLLILLVLLFMPKHSNTSDEYINCAYQPFEIKDDSNIDLEVVFHPVYFQDEDFEGIYSFDFTTVELFELNLNQNYTYDFNNGDSVINSVTYYNGFLYVAGFNIIDNPTVELNNYAVVMINLSTQTKTTFLETPYFTNVFTVNDELYVFDEDLGLRVYKIYDETGMIDMDYVAEDYILSAYSYEEYTVTVSREGDYSLYKDGAVLDTLVSASNLTERYVYMDESGIYIVDETSSGSKYNVLRFDYDGTEHTTSLQVPELNDFVFETEHYRITNDGYFTNEFHVLSSSVVNTRGKAVCNAQYTEDIVIYELNGMLYGVLDNHLHEVEEKTYSVPFKWNDPQSGFFYTLALISILVYINKKEKFSDMNFRNFNFNRNNFGGNAFNLNDFINQQTNDDTEVYNDYEN